METGVFVIKSPGKVVLSEEAVLTSSCSFIEGHTLAQETVIYATRAPCF